MEALKQRLREEREHKERVRERAKRIARIRCVRETIELFMSIPKDDIR